MYKNPSITTIDVYKSTKKAIEDICYEEEVEAPDLIDALIRAIEEINLDDWL